MDDTIPERNKVEMVNVNEEYVKQCVRKTMKDLGSCQCETCFTNACAIALNELQPKYVTTQKGALLTGINNTRVSDHVDIMVQVTKAVMKVMKNPRH